LENHQLTKSTCWQSPWLIPKAKGADNVNGRRNKNKLHIASAISTTKRVLTENKVPREQIDFRGKQERAF
jgi:hypothetical protein